MSFPSRLAGALKPMIDLAYPPRCPLCGDALGTQEGLCLDCWAQLDIPGAPQCSACQRPLPASLGMDDAPLCAPCMKEAPRHSGIAAATFYNDASRKLILSFKHGGRIALARMMGRLMAARLGPLDPETVLVPVPLHRWRIWRRGYNQSGLLANEIARITDAGVVLDALERTVATPSLGGLGRQARSKALHGSIRVSARGLRMIAGRRVVLVDDVMTSGATADACLTALLKGGAHDVRIACFARVVDGERGGSRPVAAKAENETPEVPFGTPGAA
ncbi:ComF family protein [Erythrobacteraceae bacterium WH01K]|nr:ComF family protein [Erythrobacteraceae bacterium WH01K]